MKDRFALLATIFIFSSSATLVPASTCRAFSLFSPEHTGAGINVGATYAPEPEFQFAQLTFSAWYDYEQIMGHRAPEPLKFKFETNLGIANPCEERLLASLNFYALYYLEGMAIGPCRPYLEGGAGIIYTDFQAEGQGLRWNFNPQAGVGLQWYSPDGMGWYAAFHATHISNGGLHRDNRGINGVLFQIGYFF